MPTCCREVRDKGRKEDKPPPTPRYTLKTHYLWGHHELLMHCMPPNCRKESKRANTLPILTEPLPNMSRTITFQADKKKRGRKPDTPGTSIKLLWQWEKPDICQE